MVYAALFEFCCISKYHTLTHSTAICPALTLDIVVSVACPIFTAVNCGLSPVHNPIIAGIELVVNSSITQLHAVCLPSILFVAMSCILAKVTALFVIVVAKDQVPVHVTGQVRVIV